MTRPGGGAAWSSRVRGCRSAHSRRVRARSRHMPPRRLPGPRRADPGRTELRERGSTTAKRHDEPDRQLLPWETPIAPTAWLSGRAMSARHEEKCATQARPSVEMAARRPRGEERGDAEPDQQDEDEYPDSLQAREAYTSAFWSQHLADPRVERSLAWEPIRVLNRLHGTIERDRRESPCCGQASIAPISTPWRGALMFPRHRLP